MLAATGTQEMDRMGGLARVMPLTAFTVLIASFAGSPKNPAWYNNLLANPTVTVELGNERFQARAATTAGAQLLPVPLLTRVGPRRSVELETWEIRR